MSSRINDSHEMIGRLTEEAARVALKFNARQCTTLRTGYDSNRKSIVVNGEKVEDVEKFSYLRATVDEKGGDCKAIMSRLPKTRSVFYRLGKM